MGGLEIWSDAGQCLKGCLTSVCFRCGLVHGPNVTDQVLGFGVDYAHGFEMRLVKENSGVGGWGLRRFTYSIRENLLHVLHGKRKEWKNQESVSLYFILYSCGGKKKNNEIRTSEMNEWTLKSFNTFHYDCKVRNLLKKTKNVAVAYFSQRESRDVSQCHNCDKVSQSEC